MRQDHISSLAIVAVFKKIRRSLIGEMAYARKYPLLHRPGVGPIPQHLQVVVGFEQQQVKALELGSDVWRNVAEIGCYCHPHPFSPEDKAHRVGGIMRDGEGADGDIADLKRLAGLEVLDRGK